VLEHALYIIDFVFMFVVYFSRLAFLPCCGFVAANKDVCTAQEETIPNIRNGTVFGDLD